MANYITTDSELTSIADAIRTKGGTSAPLTYPAGFVDAIDSIPSGGGGSASSEDDVRFIDYDGTIVNSYSAEDFLALSAMPANPSHEGLTAQGWNWSLADAKAYVQSYGMLDIGQMYITTSGATEIDIKMVEGRLSPVCGIGVNGKASIDWGDNTSLDIITGTDVSVRQNTTHIYLTPGFYTVKISAVEGEIGICGGNNVRSYLLYSGTNTYSGLNQAYQYSVKAIRLGNNISYFQQYSLGALGELRTITIPSYATSMFNANYVMHGCDALKCLIIPAGTEQVSNPFTSYSMKFISLPSSLRICAIGIGSSAITRLFIPDGVTSFSTASSSAYALNILIIACATTLPNYAYSDNRSIEKVKIPNVLSIGNSAFGSCYSLRTVELSNSLTSIGNSSFQNCFNLEKLIIPETVTTISGAAFYGCRSLREVEIPSSVTTLGNQAFSYCYSLTKITFKSAVTIPATLCQIDGSLAIVDLSELTTVPSLANVNAFDSTPSDMQILVPSTLLSEFQSATNWSAYASQMVGVTRG